MFMRYAIPNKTQVRTRSKYCVTDPSSIPDALRNDGLSEDVFTSIIDWYTSNRIEPEELMFASFEDDWNSFPHPTFFFTASGVRLLNEHEVAPEGELTTVYTVYASDEEDENKTPLSQFLNKWSLEIKERNAVDDTEFWFVLEFTRLELKPRRVRHVVNLFEGDWFVYEDFHIRYSGLTDFSIHHLRY